MVRRRTLTPVFRVQIPVAQFTRQRLSYLFDFDEEGDIVNSFISWIGGKKLLRKAILEQFPEQGTFDRYIEVFGGAGWILFSKESHAKMEGYNDVNNELVNLFRVVKYHPEALQKELDWILMSREEFFKAIQPARGLTDIQRAARFFIAIKESFGTDCHSFGVRPKNMQNAIIFLRRASDRLRNVVIENVDFERLIKTYDRPTSLFYLDPPYYGAENYYVGGFNAHTRLRDILGQIHGSFVLSYNDCVEIRKLYKDFEIIELQRAHNLTAVGGGGKKYKELIIKNF